ncbi:MAG: hypothetical protein J6Y07_03775 [Alphaproteobacteria bacterium]|nr:hypothetical protein [Alphaproteobacteria bacterium]
MGFLIKKIFLIYTLFVTTAYADENTFVAALRNTYSSCIGIESELAELKRMAGINTAVTGVGTGLGIGATAVGIVKSKHDKEIEDITAQLDAMGATEIKTEEQLYDILAELMDETQTQKGREMADALRAEKKRKEEQSKKLGNWRTGLLAANTATNIAGTIIATQNRTDGNLQNQIDKCKSAVSNLKQARAQAQLDGIDINEATQIINACDGFNTVDISKINVRADGAKIAGIVGATTGLTGTITSAVANTDATRQDNTDSGKQRERNLNTASNVLAGASTVASATATVFNATQIKAIKDIADVATKCTGALK